MIAVDTNILVRFYAQDDERQAAIARRILADEPAIYVPLTVLVELYFVLRFTCELAAERVHKALVHLAGLPNVTLDAHERVHAALYMSRSGIEFPEALHLAAAKHCAKFITFDDRRFTRRARRLSLRPRVELAR